MGLYPEDRTRMAYYVMAQMAGERVNLVTWRWDSFYNMWVSLCPHAFKFHPNAMECSKWAIVEETNSDNIVYDVTDCNGIRWTSQEQRIAFSG